LVRNLWRGLSESQQFVSLNQAPNGQGSLASPRFSSYPLCSHHAQLCHCPSYIAALPARLLCFSTPGEKRAQCDSRECCASLQLCSIAGCHPQDSLCETPDFDSFRPSSCTCPVDLPPRHRIYSAFIHTLDDLAYLPVSFLSPSPSLSSSLLAIRGCRLAVKSRCCPGRWNGILCWVRTRNHHHGLPLVWVRQIAATLFAAHQTSTAGRGFH
jgi:hypothetical protein